MRTIISDKEIEAMAHTIQYSENIGTGFLADDEAIERIKEAIHIVGIGEGINWSAAVMKKAVQLQGEKKGLNYYVAIKTKDTIYSGVNVSEDANIIVIKNFNDELVTVNKVDVIESVTVNNIKALDYQLIGMQEESLSVENNDSKIVLGTDGSKGYAIKKVLETSDKKGNNVEVYTSKDDYDFFINSNEREQESLFAGFSGEAGEILEEMEQEEQQTKEPTGYYFLSVRSVYKDMPCTIHIHKELKNENILSVEEFKKIYTDVPEANSYGETISYDIFRMDEIPKVLKDIELDEPLTITPLFKNQYKSDNYASLSVMGYDLRPKPGGMISLNIKGYLLSFCFDETQENESLDNYSTPIPF